MPQNSHSRKYYNHAPWNCKLPWTGKPLPAVWLEDVTILEKRAKTKKELFVHNPEINCLLRSTSTVTTVTLILKNISRPYLFHCVRNVEEKNHKITILLNNRMLNVCKTTLFSVFKFWSRSCSERWGKSVAYQQDMPANFNSQFAYTSYTRPIKPCILKGQQEQVSQHRCRVFFFCCHYTSLLN